MVDLPHIVFSRPQGLFCLGAPDCTLRAAGAADVRQLAPRVTEALNGDYRFACGLLPYEAGLALHGLAAQPEAEVVVHLYRQRPRPYHPAPERSFAITSPFRAEQDGARYRAAVRRILAYLSAGDGYQVNYAQRFQARWSGEPLAAFDRLVAAHPAPHACFFRCDERTVFGVSPERFMRIDNSTVTTEPIKGSRPRGRDAEQDRKLGEQLLASIKDRAENLMIVDLLRNDLGRFCVPGSVRVDALFELRRFSNVQHLVSTVSGTLAAGITPLAALLDAFPGGSITGAPKKRAMEIIAELEPAPRGAYCGSFFWQDEHGHFDSNILIRTLQTEGDRLYCHGGGGIVHDSDIDEEHEESHFKVARLMSAL